VIRSVKKSNLAWTGRLVLPLLVLALAAFVYLLYGFEGVLLRDYSIYLYSGQRMVEGIPPYVSVFDHKGPLSPMLAGLGAMWAKELNWDDVYTVRLVFYAIGCLTVAAVYLLGKSLFESQLAGLFGALTFLGFYGFAQPAASGPEPKTPMVLFQTLSLLLAIQKRWFWAGFFGSLAFLVWPPMAIFPLVAFILAVTSFREERYRAALRALAGIAAPLVVVGVYFYSNDALDDFFDGFILFNFVHLVRGQAPLTWHLAGVASNIVLPYGTMLVPILIGLAMIVRLYFLKPFEYRFAPIVLSFPAPILWSLRDFQLADDFYVFLPYVAVGFGAFLVLAIHHTKAVQLLAVLLCAILILAPALWLSRGSLLLAGNLYVFIPLVAAGFAVLLVFALYRAKTSLVPTVLLSGVLLTVALANTLDEVNASASDRLKGTDISLSQQREGALEVEHRLGEGARLASINSPQVLVLLHRENPNPYLWLTHGVDKAIEVRTPGGFEGWIQELEESDPDAISFFGEGQSLTFSSYLTPEHKQEFFDWLRTRYHAEKIGPWWLYVKNSQ
jgi:hypothetical protein